MVIPLRNDIYCVQVKEDIMFKQPWMRKSHARYSGKTDLTKSPTHAPKKSIQTMQIR
jgi:hypothetical protein